MDRALALDLGSTRIKAGVLADDGRLRLGADAFAATARMVLAETAARAPGLPVGIASQRSSFVLWEAATGRPVTPLVSWQDRRADAWCAAHRALEAGVSARTGLPLSPHYAGPKLAVLLEADPALRSGLEAGSLRFGTLETYLIALASGGRVHHTDLSMAARTLLVDLDAGAWDPELGRTFGVPLGGLPAIGDTRGLKWVLEGGVTVAATVADQGAAALAVLGDAPDAALVNLGTGGFVLRPVAGADARPPGYLFGPLSRAGGHTAWAVEGTINAIGPAVTDLGPGPTPLPAEDPSPTAFCLPDSAGVGAPHWRAGLGPVLSPEAHALARADRRRVVLEGIVFRVCEIVDDLAKQAPVNRLVLAGGLAAEPFLAPALAACAGRSVVRLEEPEATLIGAARLAAGLPFMAPRATPVSPAGADGAYLAGKYRRWRAWLATALA
jgi:glycerol kinase